jgi:hypothetical protein
MARRTFSPNALEPVLASGITDVQATIPLDDASGLTAPGYMVIDPDDIAKREFFLFESINSNTLETLTRGLAGSAAGAQAHDSGITVRTVLTSQALDDLFLDIIDLEADQHTKYLDSEAVTAMGVEGDSNPLNHARYADSEAVSAVGTPWVGLIAAEDHHARYTDSEAAAKIALDALYMLTGAAPNAHTIESHSDTTGTGPELDTLTGGGETTLHSHAGGVGYAQSFLTGGM